MAKDILGKLDTEVRQMPTQQNGSESRRPECCIYRVPDQLRNVNSKAYDPNLISIGPLHHGNKGLEAMEKAKLNYFRKFTEGDGVDEKKMCDIVISIKNQEERLRNCYSEKSILMESSVDFVKMILLDAVFIIQFLLESKDDTDGPKNFEPRMTFDIREDLLLLENQLPLFILQEIYDRVYPRSQDAKAIPFLDLATCHFIKESFLKRVETRPDIVEGSRHFTDLLRNLMLAKAVKIYRQCDDSPTSEKFDWQRNDSPTSEKFDGQRDDSPTSDLFDGQCDDSRPGPSHLYLICDDSRPRPSYPDASNLPNRRKKLSKDAARVLPTRVLKYSAVMLLKAGVRFEASKSKCLVNITFDKGVLTIPLLEVDHKFERRIRNIMALEQCLYEHEANICSYMKLMDHLIDSAEDVGLLVRKGIIVHRLGDDAEVSYMINHLCEHIGYNYALFGRITRGLNAHYDNPWNHIKATLKLVYFPNIWRGTATVAAAILLILTFIQAVCSVISVS